MKRRFLPIVLGFWVGATGSAVAADLGSFETAPTYVLADSTDADWAGAFLGVSAGVIAGEFGYSDCCIGPDGWATSPLASLHAGYNWQRGNLVFGVEADITAFSLVAEGSGGVGDFKEKALSTFRARVGRTFGQSLFYATAGVGLTLVETSNPGFSSDSAIATGFAGGVGVETRSLPGLLSLGENWTGRAEFLYVDVPKTRLNSGSPTVGGSDNFMFRVGLNRYF